MKIETLKKDNRKKIAIIAIAVVSITLVGVFASSFAKYKLTQSIPLANGTINYKSYDFKIMAMYQQKDGSTCTEDNCYDEISTMPSNGYTINKTKSYCTLDNKNKDTTVNLYTNDNDEHVIANLSKQDKCYLYFDEKVLFGNEYILREITAKEPIRNSFSNVAKTDEGIFTGIDNDGTTYYYRGSVTNNYLKFAGFWWRIIRINGDGTIRIIYDGTAYHANGSSTVDSQIGTCQFNTSNNDNAYVGFMYGAPGSTTYEETHANINKSNVMEQLEIWYTNNLVSYTSKIDTNAGFCGDRATSTVAGTGYTGSGYGASTTAYDLFSRIRTQSNSWASTIIPMFVCQNSNNLYTIKGASKGNRALDKPIGLITADEVIYAGGFGGKDNKSYYLYNGQNYWTMSPAYFASSAYVFFVYSGGALSDTHVGATYGVRPVINLRADVLITGSGTQNDPYVVN